LTNSGPFIYRTYTPADSIQKPFLFTLRICDNLDAQYTRLTIVQRDPNLLKYLRRLYVDKSLRFATINPSSQYNTVLTQAQNRAVNYVGADLQATINASPELATVISGTNSESFLHFYSNWILQTASIQGTVLSITLRDVGLPNELKFPGHVGVALYQINRLATSMFSLFVNGSSLLDQLYVNISAPLPSGQTLFPLKAFTKRPTYVDGTANSGLICGQYCIPETPSLSLSSEQCMDDQNNIVAFCDNADFGNTGAFVDLTYPTEVQPTSAIGSISSSLILIIILVSQV